MRIIFLFIALVALFGCHPSDKKNQITLYEYSKNDLISTKKGVLLDSTAPVVPFLLKSNDSTFFTGVDTNLNKRNYRITWMHHGQLLYNYFTGVEKIQMYYSGAWIDPILISFCRDRNAYWIQSQSIEKSASQIRNPQLKIDFAKTISDYETLVQYQPISIDGSLWDSVKSVLVMNGFNAGKRLDIKNMLDGSAILVQVHLTDGYNFFARNYYSDSTERIRDFFLDQAGFKTVLDTSGF